MFDWFKKIIDYVVPLEPVPGENEEEKKVETKAEEVNRVQAEVPVKRVAAGGGAAFVTEKQPAGYVSTSHSGTTSVNGVHYTAYKSTNERPNLKLVKAPELIMRIYNPAEYNQEVIRITDDILANKAVVVNYERLNMEQQRSICDFVDGACYAVNGSATRISDKIVLYAPAGVETGDLIAMANSAASRYH